MRNILLFLASVWFALFSLTQVGEHAEKYLGWESGPDGLLLGIIVTSACIILVVALIVVNKIRMKLAEWRHLRAMDLSDVDRMTGSDFEMYVGKILRSRGYTVRVNGKAGDLGVDVIAHRKGKKYAIQVKRYKDKHYVSRRAVSDAVAGKHYYHCNDAMVITNSYFTKGAKTLAKSTGCELVDRKILQAWIADFRS